MKTSRWTSILLLALLCCLTSIAANASGDCTAPTLVRRTNLQGDEKLQLDLNKKFDADPSIRACHQYEDQALFLYKIAVGKVEVYEWTSFGACSPLQTSPSAHCVLSWADDHDHLKRTNIRPFSWKGSHLVKRGEGVLELFDSIRLNAFPEEQGLNKECACLLFAYLFLADDCWQFPDHITISSDTLRDGRKEFNQEQNAVLGLQSEKTLLERRDVFTVYIRYSDGGLLRVEAEFGDAGQISWIGWTGIPTLAH